jgi:hypothetical protein
VGDNTADDGETVIATLTGGGSTYTIDSVAGAATVTIADQPLTVSVERWTDGEENVSDAVFRFTRAGDLTSSLTVSYTSTGTATSGTDFTALSGTITFAEDEDEAYLTVSITDDATAEQTETIVVTLDTSSSYELGNASDALFVRDNDRRQVRWISDGTSSDPYS